MSGHTGELPIIVTAELPRAIRSAWAPDEHVLVLADWLDEDGRAAVVADWRSGHLVGTDVMNGADTERHGNGPLTCGDVA